MKSLTKPLTIITTYGRFDLTKRMLTSLEPSQHLLDTVIIDNGNPKDQCDWEVAWSRDNGATTVLVGRNIGCPRGLNLALQSRKPGQPVIKLDNDILMPDGPQWLYGVERLVENFDVNKYPVAMVGACFEPVDMVRVKSVSTWELKNLYQVFPLIGHAVYHTALFMERVGYFDVVHPDHLYGFEDNIMSTKAAMLGFNILAWHGWVVEDIQRRSAIEKRDDHVRAMRPYYNNRIKGLSLGGSFYTGPDGYPARRMENESFSRVA